MNVGRKFAEFVGRIPGLKGLATSVQLALRRQRARQRKGLGHPTIPASWVPRGTRPHVILVGHEATRSGAPMILLRLARHLRSTAGIGCRIVLLADGPLREDFAAIAPTIVVPNVVDVFAGLADVLRHSSPPCVVVCNTIATARVAEQCRLQGVPVVAWIHETATVIDEFFGGRKTVQRMARASRRIVCPSQLVATSLTEAYGIPPGKISVVPYGIDAPPADLDRVEARQAVRKDLGLRPDARIVLACGRAEQRKGVDLFVQLASKVIDRQPAAGDDVHFVWVGRWDDQSKPWARHDIRQLGLSERIHFVGEKRKPARYFAAADAFVMPSREESCGMVALEAAATGCPAVSFHGAVGAAEMLSEDEAIFVPYLDVDAMATAVRERLDRGPRQAVESPIFERYPWSRCLDDMTRAIQDSLEPSTAGGARVRSAVPLSSDAWKHACGQNVLVIAYGPPPIPGVATVEGTGLRSWGLSAALAKAVSESVVTLAIPAWYDLPAMPAEFAGVRIARWGHDTLAEMIAEYDVIVASYCLGDDSVRITEAVLEHQVLVWDAYVPIHVEVCARRSANRHGELIAFERDRRIWEACLKRGDYFLCATEAQRLYYTGVLAAIGRINPVTYDDDPFLIVPYGIHEAEAVPRRRPCSELISASGAWKLLWFGGVYPWFDIGCLLEAVKALSEKHAVGLVIVGAKNPFVQHPDFEKCHERMMKMIEDPAIRPLVHLVDWVPFHERGDWYLDADMICFANQQGMENLLAWRTRVVDYIWTRTPLATNGGDPLSEEMIAAGAAVRVDATDPAALAATLTATLGDAAKLAAMRQAADTIREKYLWQNAVRPLADVIRGARVG
jgi:glycosyltransferase involved in cell wall biosynthesis